MKSALLCTALAAFTLNAVALKLPRSAAFNDNSAELDNLIGRIESLQLRALEAEGEKLKKRGLTPTCHIGNVAMRREYGSLSKAERQNYVNAVKCLRKKPARTPSSVAAGAKSRFDDFTVTHMQQTLSIHFTGNFLAWHRWFLYEYEQALRNECGYKGYAPYWDWVKYADAPEKSPIFNGDPYSLGGNGKYIPHNGTIIQVPEGVVGQPLYLPPGLGGGCVEQGPFTTVNLGPLGLTTKPPGPNGGLGYNPRCLSRDVGPALNQRYANASSVLSVLKARTMEEFRVILEGVPNTPEIGPHGGGHFTINGDPGGDLFTSPSDPAFWLHHGQVDRIWTLWQSLDPKNRQYVLSGTRTWLNVPPSPNTTLDEALVLGYAGVNSTIGAVMKTTAGQLCYIYV